MLGRWQPWHDGHLALFRKCLNKTGKYVSRLEIVKTGMIVTPLTLKKLKEILSKDCQTKVILLEKEYIIQLVPNIVNITYGRKVGYKIEQEHFDKQIEYISATKIRNQMGLK